MKAIRLLSLLSALAAAPCLPAAANTQGTPSARAELCADSELTVPQALSELPCFNSTPSADARYYIYLQSASWCFYCVQDMPDIAAAYEQMKEKGVELVLIGCDDTPEAALNYLKKYNATFPGIHYKDVNPEKLPGYRPAVGVPDATFVDRQGNVLARGHGAMVKRWRSVLHISAVEKSAEQPQ